MAHWTTYELVDADGDQVKNDTDRFVSYMREYRQTGGIESVFFAHPEPGQSDDPEDSWTWGPAPEDIDWTGFPDAVAETQEQINGPFVETAWTLPQCWESDLGQMVDYNLLRDNATAIEMEIIDGCFRSMLDTDEEAENRLIGQIRQRVMAQGWYIRDSKITREMGR